MIARWNGSGWQGVSSTAYKHEQGTWPDVARHVLFDSEASGFQTRYFEIAPGGSTSFERHRHEHCVLVLRGLGRVRLGEKWHEIGSLDFVHVLSGTPHQFVANAEACLGILCIVDRERDAPEILCNGAPAEASI